MVPYNRFGEHFNGFALGQAPASSEDASLSAPTPAGRKKSAGATFRIVERVRGVPGIVGIHLVVIEPGSRLKNRPYRVGGIVSVGALKEIPQRINAEVIRGIRLAMAVKELERGIAGEPPGVIRRLVQGVQPPVRIDGSTLRRQIDAA
jgi:hypothetical protein